MRGGRFGLGICRRLVVQREKLMSYVIIIALFQQSISAAYLV
jgi:hypothetical protein